MFLDSLSYEYKILSRFEKDRMLIVSPENLGKHSEMYYPRIPRIKRTQNLQNDKQ